MPDLSASIDLYCERTGPGLWAEPLNTLSNLAFIAAGVLLWLRARPEHGETLLTARVVPLLICAVGAGSLSFHLFATVWGAILDSAFILIFAAVFLYAFVRDVSGAGAQAALGAAGALVLAALLATRLPDPGLNGSQAYAPMLLGLAALAAHARRRRPAHARGLLAATLLFGVSLAFRTADAAVCAAVPTGTHVVWHLLNALLLYRLGAILRLPV